MNAYVFHVLGLSLSLLLVPSTLEVFLKCKPRGNKHFVFTSWSTPQAKMNAGNITWSQQHAQLYLEWRWYWGVWSVTPSVVWPSNPSYREDCQSPSIPDRNNKPWRFLCPHTYPSLPPPRSPQRPRRSEPVCGLDSRPHYAKSWQPTSRIDNSLL